MADYARIYGSKEKIGIILSTTNGSNFIVESATVKITHRVTTHGSTSTSVIVSDVPCMVDNKTPQKSHTIDYLWECKVSTTNCTAAFSAKLSDGQIIVRSVSISVS